MAQSTFATKQYSAEHFVESCGAILFDLSDPSSVKVCLIHHMDVWLLAKGRRNIGETRKDAALREVREETGFRCHLHPLQMAVRATTGDPAEDDQDKARLLPALTEPFMVTIRELKDGMSIKLIYWYIAALDGGVHDTKLSGEDQIEPEFFLLLDAVEKLTFQSDREVLLKAMRWIERSIS
ncbi:hypothetical protein EJ04DRAFT_495689 [Polyplosphaeria fusca]|uniref:Nudix hydrolase domain-containing protein n=1 Tax=Polyplosphaeria fusca TaxID=682080 RepID=A0A9P4V1G5_9PLEO|nr:hypothetical protein EJ04DRAFT_495689 [Polyplosphaeria fusca]